MRSILRSALVVAVLGSILLTVSLAPFAAAPKPVPPPPPTPPTCSAPCTGHEAYPFAGIPPQSHEQATMYNTFPTPQQQGLYSKFVGFYQGYSVT